MTKLLCQQQRFYLLLLFFFSFQLRLFAQKNSVISGFVEDAASGERLIGATLVDDATRNGTVTNTYGFFSFSTTAGVKNLTFSYIGYKAQNFTFNLQSDTSINIKLDAGSVLNTVEINAQGQILQTHKITDGIEQQALKVAQYPNGLYFVQLQNTLGELRVEKIQVSH